MKLLPVDGKIKDTVVTIASKFSILLFNFIIVVITTNLWGSEGRGEIALVIANIAIISILGNVTCGSTLVFHASREDKNLIFNVALSGSILFSLIGSLTFSFIVGFQYFKYLFIISLLSTLKGSISTYWLGKRNFGLYNLLNLLTPLSVLIFILVFYYIFKIYSINACFYGYYAGLGLVLAIGLVSILPLNLLALPGGYFKSLRNILTYGFRNEFNSFIQLLNYRLSYFFIAKWLGLSELGVFSIALSFAESIWIISRSLSALHFSNVSNATNYDDSIAETKVFARQSLWLSLIVLGILIILPKSLFVIIFGSGFAEIKLYLIYLIPGILIMAVANLYDQYFSGIGKLSVLTKSHLAGLVVTVALLVLLTQKYQLPGVCISLNLSYLVTSVILFSNFRTLSLLHNKSKTSDNRK